MKKTITLIAIICVTAMSVMAQPRAIGARGGYNMEVSYQHSTLTGMVEVDAGLSPFIYQKSYVIEEDGTILARNYRYGRAQLTVAYDWIMDIVTDLHWYIGLAAGVSWGYGEFFDMPHYNSRGNLVTYSRLGLPIGGQIGIEYDFKVPLNLSLDWRPMFNVFALRQGDLVNSFLNIAIGVRYRF